MSIELPAIPPLPNADSTPAQWDLYLRIVALYSAAGTQDAINAQTAQMVLMTTAAERNAALMQQLLEQPPAPASGLSEAFLLSLLRLVLDKPEAPAP